MTIGARNLLEGLVLLGVLAAFSACSQSSGGDTGTGGKTATGGSGGSGKGGSGGGSSATGGSSAAGGSTASGGTTGSGGVVGTGGSKATGGTGSGGDSGSTGMGGTNATGGVAQTGGAKTGGSPGSGGSGPRVDGGHPDAAAGGNGPGDAGTGGSGGSTITCPTPALKAGDANKTVKVGSDSRTYILHVPAKYDGTKPVPLVVDFHPIGGSGSGELGSSPYKSVTDAEGVITAYPNGKSGPMGGAWNVGPCCVKDVDDVAFAKALVEDVEKVACIDTKRVYAVGFSMGGGMSHYAACHAADVFAAVAPAAFDLLKENQDACKPTRPITVVSFRSTGDSVVPYDGGYSNVVSGMPINFLGAKGTQQKWAEINQCTGSASAEDSNGCSTYSSCASGVQVTLCTKKGGSHEPGNANVGWPILKKYTMP